MTAWHRQTLCTHTDHALHVWVLCYDLHVSDTLLGNLIFTLLASCISFYISTLNSHGTMFNHILSPWMGSGCLMGLHLNKEGFLQDSFTKSHCRQSLSNNQTMSLIDHVYMQLMKTAKLYIILHVLVS